MAVDWSQFELEGQQQPQQGGFDASMFELETPDLPGGAATSAALGIAQGGSLGLSDELGAGVASGFGGIFPKIADFLGLPHEQGPTYDEALQQMRGIQKQSEQAHPVASGAGKLGGALGLSLAVPGIASGAEGMAVLPALAVEGGLWNAAYGFGEGEGGLQNRVVNAAEGGLVGEAAGPVIGGGLIGAGKTAGWVGGRLANAADDLRMSFLGVKPRDMERNFAKGMTFLDDAGNVVDAENASSITNKLKQDFGRLKGSGFFDGMRSDPEQALIKAETLNKGFAGEINSLARSADEMILAERANLQPESVVPKLKSLKQEIDNTIPREGFEEARQFAQKEFAELTGQKSIALSSLRSAEDALTAAQEGLSKNREILGAIESEYNAALEMAQSLTGTQRASAIKRAHAKYADAWGAAFESVENAAQQEARLFSLTQRGQRELSKLAGKELDSTANLAELGSEGAALEGRVAELTGQRADLKSAFDTAWKGNDPNLGSARDYAQSVGLANPSRGRALRKELGEVRANWKESDRLVGDALEFKRSAGAQPKIFSGTQSALEGDAARLKRKIYGAFSESATNGIKRVLGDGALKQWKEANAMISALKNFEEPLIKSASQGLGKWSPFGFVSDAAQVGAATALNPTLGLGLTGAKLAARYRPLESARALDVLGGGMSRAANAANTVGSLAAPLTGALASRGEPATTSPARPLELEYTSKPSPNSAPASYEKQAKGLLNPALSAAVESVESGGQADAISHKGAIGTHQVMPIAARDVLRSRGIDDRQYTDADLKEILKRPGMSKAFGEAYLQILLQRFDGDLELALAAYNGGPSRLDARGRDVSRMPKETQDYVPQVFAKLYGGA